VPDELPGLPSGVVTFLLTDIEGSTALWDSLPATMATALQRHERIVSEAVAANAGTVVKGRGEGDSTLSVFARASDAGNAALCIRRAIARERWPEQVRLPTRIALHTGEAQLRDGDYFGGTLNRAARIRSLATGGQVLCSRTTADLICDSPTGGLAVTELGPHHLRGLRRTETVFEVRDAGEAAEAAPAAGLDAGDLDELYPSFDDTPTRRGAEPVRDTPRFVGRAAEIEEIRCRWDAAQKGEASTVLLKGAMGIGKTRLLEEVARRTDPDTARIVWGRAYEHTDAPYLALRADLLPLLVAQYGEPARVLAATFDADAEGRNPLADPDDRGRLMLTFAQAVVDLASDRPLLLIVDDVHWADHATLDVLRHITWLVQRQPAPLLVLAACRVPLESGEVAAELGLLEREPRCRALPLPALADHEVGGLAAQLGLTATRAVIQRIGQVTRGNPLLVRQLVEQMEDRDADEAVEEVIDYFTPTSATDAIARRLRQLSPNTRDVLTRAALLQPSAIERTLSRAAPGLSITDALGEGRREGVVEMRGPYVEFSHPMYARVLISEVDLTERRRMHRDLAAVLSSESPQTASAYEIASHFLRAGDLAARADVLHAAQRGGNEAFASCAWREAAECFEAAAAAAQGIDGVPPELEPNLHFRAALCRMWNLDDERALAEYDEAIRGYEALQDRRALVRVRLERMRAELDTAGPLAPVDAGALERAIDELAPDDGLRALALADLAMAYAVSGRTTDAAAAAEHALQLAATSAPRASARAELALSVTSWTELALERALTNLVAAADHARAAGDVFSHLAAAMRQPLTLLWLGRVREADEAAAAALRIGEQHNLVSGMVYALAARVGAASLCGRADDAAMFAEEAILRHRLGDYSWGLAFSLPAYAAVESLTSGPDAGLAVLARWSDLRAIDTAGYPWGEFTDVFDLAVRMLADPASRSSRALRPPWLTTTQLSGAVGLSGVAAAAAEVAWWTRDEQLARNAARALRWCERSGMEVVDGWLSSVPRAYGVALAATGQLDDGLEQIRRGRVWASEAEAELERSLCGWWECELHRKAGSSPDGDAVAAASTCPMP
jgi:class 3 adenylate cyclase